MFFSVAALKKKTTNQAMRETSRSNHFLLSSLENGTNLGTTNDRKSISIVMEQQILENLGVARPLRKKSIRNPN
jgi:hypothetical protein